MDAESPDRANPDQNASGAIPALVQWVLRARPDIDGTPDGDGDSSDGTLPPGVEATAEALAAWEQLLHLAQQDLQRRELEGRAHILSPDALHALDAERKQVARYRERLAATCAHDAAEPDRRGLDSHRDGLRRALELGATVAQAQGMLMARHQLSPEAAFALLVRLAQHTGVSVTDMAAEVVAATEARWD